MINKTTISEVLLRYKILIVDDQLANVVLLENILNLSGFKQILSTTDSASAIKKIEQHQPAILLLDLMMPEVTGFEILSELSKTSDERNFMPILVLTADTSPKSKEKALSLGASDFLTKPFDISELNLRINNLLTTKFLMDQWRDQKDLFQQQVETRTKNLIKAKEEAERNEKKYKLIFDTHFDAINLFFVDESGPSNFIESNSACETVLGYSKEELSNLTINDLELAFFDENFFQKNLKKLLETGSIELETTIRKKKWRSEKFGSPGQYVSVGR